MTSFFFQTTNQAPTETPNKTVTRCTGYFIANTSEPAADEVVAPPAGPVVDVDVDVDVDVLLSKLDWPDDKDEIEDDVDVTEDVPKLSVVEEEEAAAVVVVEEVIETVLSPVEVVDVDVTDSVLVNPLVLMGRILRGSVGVTLSDCELTTAYCALTSVYVACLKLPSGRHTWRKGTDGKDAEREQLHGGSGCQGSQLRELDSLEQLLFIYKSERR